MHKIRIIKCKSNLPEQNFQVPADFAGDKSYRFSTSEVYRIVCDKCGLVDKAGTKEQAISRGERHSQGK